MFESLLYFRVDKLFTVISYIHLSRRKLSFLESAEALALHLNAISISRGTAYST
jgi:hypothetical protein